jgi:hypothetical protein
VKQTVRVQIDGEWHEVTLERHGVALRGWERLYGSVAAFVQEAIEYFTSALVHQHFQNARTLQESLKRAPVKPEQIEALRVLGATAIVRRLNALAAFEAAEAEIDRQQRQDSHDRQEKPDARTETDP